MGWYGLQRAMKALNADPAFNPLAGLSPRQRKIYRKLTRYGIDAKRALAEVKK